MVDFTNLKLDWNHILGRQIESLQEQFAGTDIKKLFSPIVELLSGNKIPSKVMLSGGEARAYSYVMESSILDDRLIFTMGFDIDSGENLERGRAILDWVEQISSRTGKLAILDNIFNGNFMAPLLIERGFMEDKRIKMKSPLKDIITNNHDLKNRKMGEIGLLDIHDIPMSDIEESQEIAYRDSPEHFLLYRKNGKNLTYRIFFDAYYGKIMTTASCILYNNGIIGSCLVSDGSEEFMDHGVPLIVDIFIRQESRGMGLTGLCLLHAAEKLELLGHTFLQLWVNEKSPARQIYEKIGMRENGEVEVLHWKDFRPFPAGTP